MPIPVILDTDIGDDIDDTWAELRAAELGEATSPPMTWATTPLSRARARTNIVSPARSL